MSKTNSPNAVPPEFQRFRDLTEHLMAVSKSEVQEKMTARTRKQSKRKKQK